MEHTCSVTDKQFISRTELSMTALGIWGDDYRRGEATEAEVIAEARRATVRVETSNPSDPSLRATKTFTNSGMTGTEHVEHADERLRSWFEARARFGFSE